MKTLVALVPMLVLLAVDTPAAASGDLRAVGFEVVALGGGRYSITVEHDALWGSDQPNFSYSVVVTQRRGGQIVTVPYQSDESISTLDACDSVCGSSCESNNCEYKVAPDPTVWGGKCGWKATMCPLEKPLNERNASGCTCSRSDAGRFGAFEAMLTFGDVISVTITPGGSFQDINTGNNTMQFSVL